MEVSGAYNLISSAIDAGRTANAYLVCGDIARDGEELARRILLKLFPGEPDKIEQGIHPDVFRVVPQGKSRTVKVERGKDDTGPGIRDGIVGPISQTSYSGGWKVGIIVGADRMQLEAANALLKTLEEPPRKTLFLLLTDSPDSILPTIVSRSQRIDLPSREGPADPEVQKAVDALFSVRSPVPVAKRYAIAKDMADLLDGLEKEAQDADRPVVRKDFFKAVLAIVRGWMVGGELEYYRAFKNIEAVETAYAQCEKYIPKAAAITDMMDRIAFP